MVGDLLILIPKSLNEFIAYVLDYDEDIEELQSALSLNRFRIGVSIRTARRARLKRKMIALPA